MKVSTFRHSISSALLLGQTDQYLAKRSREVRDLFRRFVDQSKRLRGTGRYTETAADTLVPIYPGDSVIQGDGVDLATFRAESAPGAGFRIADAEVIGPGDLRSRQLQLSDPTETHAAAPAAVTEEHRTLAILGGVN